MPAGILGRLYRDLLGTDIREDYFLIVLLVLILVIQLAALRTELLFMGFHDIFDDVGIGVENCDEPNRRKSQNCNNRDRQREKQQK